MVMIPWQYYRNLTTFKQQMNQLFDRFFERELGSLGAVIPSSPLTTIKETRNRYLITLDVKGYEPKDLTVTVEGSVLIVEGRQKSTEEVSAEHWTANSFKRLIRFKHHLKTDAVVARYCDDKLVILLPKEDLQQPRTIRITF